MRTLLIEDEAAVAVMINKGLSESGYSVTVAPDGHIGLDMALNNNFDIIILDIMLPGINGLELCKKLRRNDISTPILMLTALDSTENIVSGLDNGADDYMTKPFKFPELEARLRNLARRNSNTVKPSDLLQAGDLVVNTAAKSVHRSGQELSLTATEYRLLEFMLRNKGKVLSRIELLENVWSINFNMGTNVVDVYVNYLRKKIDKNNTAKLIHTVTGMGYIIKG
ncbi:response regulator transcription factor [Pseudoflavitalea rhizosphaerae]|uniref:response regulator transcription factor n=1 Tax=Pseudoflavitalea rhizosphaerae TaxID=1884793 RepID=UPI000F8EC408|nr:response regulator transcription factor [Pseudoflavitalea rhizosphaerae]